MKPKVCCFCGHREIHEDFHVITKAVEDNVEYMIKSFNVQYFLSGGMGEFDKLCESVVQNLKLRFPHIKLCLVAVSEKNHVQGLYDKIICPDFENSAAIIVKKNRAMVDKSDFMLAYVHKNNGGARITYEYAKLKNELKIINIYA